MSAVLKFQYELETIDCRNCFMTIAVPAGFIRERRRDHKTFYCPNGHQNFFPGKSDLEQLQEQVSRKDMELIRARERGDRFKQEAEHKWILNIRFRSS